jgi:hypothetical protein
LPNQPADDTDGAAGTRGPGEGGKSDGGGPTSDGSTSSDGATSGGDGSANDGSSADGAARDGSTGLDATFDTGGGGIITGGPCLAGVPGATALRVRFVQAGSGVQASYEVDGLPDKSRWHAAAYGYQIGFTASFVDPFLGPGGVGLDSSDFIDIEYSTAGVSSITQATLSIYGRSYDTTASGSFNWQTQWDTGATAMNFVSNVAPYQWYAADVTSAIAPSDSGGLLRVKAGPNSDSLVVNRVELCVVAP